MNFLDQIWRYATKL